MPRKASQSSSPGVRLQRERTLLEVLYTKPMTDSLDAYPRSGRWLVRFSARKGFSID